ncbi:AraC family ligand binding domain-containing protein [Burkholderia sp. L27(2015)]|uniref:AraC family ligand binding domain-containing protein n=1 Tax=Burkholderia sp. L27(2015) TaxID=1641858 RepID=UPI00349EBBC0
MILSTALFVEFRFEPHYHLDCHIALVTSGVQRQSFHGESPLLTRGAIFPLRPLSSSGERREFHPA